MPILLKPDGNHDGAPHLPSHEAEPSDMIYHEHFSYFSLLARSDLAKHAHRVKFVEGRNARWIAPFMDAIRVIRRNQSPIAIGAQGGKRSTPCTIGSYAAFEEQVKKKRNLLAFLIDAKSAGKSVAGTGLGKNTLLNYCGIRTVFLDYTVDRNPYKHGRFTPGTHIPIFPPEKIDETKPDYLLILPWNFKDEIVAQMARIRTWGGKFVVPIPSVQVID